MNLNQAKEAIKDRIRVEELLGCDFLDHEHKVSCVFPGHNDRNTPNLSVYPNNTVFCWVCRRTEDVIGLHQVMNNLAKPIDAIRELAPRINITLDRFSPEEEAQLDKEQKRIAALEFATRFYEDRLHQEGSPVSQLFDRGFTLELIQRQRVGYADGNLVKRIKSILTSTNPEKLNGLALEDFIAAGVVKEKKDKESGKVTGHRDALYRRIVFPVIARGRVVHMSGRTIDPPKDEVPKYLHLSSPMKWMYNEDASRAKVAYICEGIPDTLTLMGWRINACGNLGTSGIKKHHAPKFANADAVYLCWDTDKAGRDGALDAGEFLDDRMAEGIPYIVQLPDGVKDLNEFAQTHTREDFMALIQEAKPLISAMIAAAPADLSGVERGRTISKILRRIAKRPPTQQDPYVQELRTKFGLKASAVDKELKAITQQLARETSPREDEKEEIVWEESKTFAPAMDFDFDDTPTAYTTVYLPIRSVQVNDAMEKEVVVQPIPHLITSTITPEGVEVICQKVAEAKLPSSVMRRIPDYDTITGLWRLHPSHRYSVSNFTGGKVGRIGTHELFDGIFGLVRDYVWTRQIHDTSLLTVWTMGTYMARLFGAYPYLTLNGVKHSGKTNLMTMAAWLAFNALESASNRAASIFRAIEACGCTWLLDESEGLEKVTEETQDQMSILLSGYKLGAKVYRVEKDTQGNFVNRAYEAFSPKMFGSIKMLNPTLLDRTILIRTERADAESRASLSDTHQTRRGWQARARELRDMSYIWALTRFPEISEIFEGFGKIDGIANRERELWLPMLAIAALVDRDRGVTKPEHSLYEAIYRLALEKIADKLQNEMMEANELTIVQALQDMLEAGQLEPIRPGSEFFPTVAVAKALTDYIREEKGLPETWRLTERGLVKDLKRIRVLGNDDHAQIRPPLSRSNKSCIRLVSEQLESARQKLTS
jgi:DNA primase catalytic core